STPSGSGVRSLSRSIGSRFEMNPQPLTMTTSLPRSERAASVRVVTNPIAAASAHQLLRQQTEDAFARYTLALERRQRVGVEHHLGGTAAECLERAKPADVRLRRQLEHQFVIVGSDRAIVVEPRQLRRRIVLYRIHRAPQHAPEHHYAAVGRSE